MIWTCATTTSRRRCYVSRLTSGCGVWRDCALVGHSTGARWLDLWPSRVHSLDMSQERVDVGLWLAVVLSSALGYLWLFGW